MDKFEIAANLAAFLTEKTGRATGVFKGRLLKAQQISLFGRYLGKGLIHIDGSNETVSHTVSRCFGLDYEITFASSWVNLPYYQESKP